MGEMRNFSDTGLTCYANVKLDSGEPCFISIAQSGILVKRSRLGLFGPALYKQSDLYKNAMTAKALHYLYPTKKTPAGITNAVLQAFTNAVLHCSSAAEVTNVLNGAIQTAERKSGKSIEDLPLSIG
jgi:hypothetical protein